MDKNVKTLTEKEKAKVMYFCKKLLFAQKPIPNRFEKIFRQNIKRLLAR